MPSNANWICFDCRAAVREAKTSPRIPLCPSCGVECFDLGSKVAVPKRDKLAAWRKLKLECLRRQDAMIKNTVRHRLQEARETEARLAKAKAQPASPGRAKFIADLQVSRQANPLKAIQKTRYRPA